MRMKVTCHQEVPALPACQDEHLPPGEGDQDRVLPGTSGSASLAARVRALFSQLLEAVTYFCPPWIPKLLLGSS